MGNNYAEDYAARAELPVRKIFGGLVVILCLIFGWVASDQLFYNVEAGELVVAQDYLSGHLECWTTPGYQFRKFAKVASFRRSSPVWFDAKHDNSNGLPLRFNDAGKATALGSGQVFMPSDCEKLKSLRQIYGSQEDVNHALVNRAVTKAVFNTGRLLSSSDSFASKRGDILYWIEDQANNGIYDVKPVRILKPLVKNLDNTTSGGDDTGIQTVEVAIITAADGTPARKEASELEAYGIKLGNVTLNEIDYDEPTQKQIDSQRESQQAIQTAKARAIAADQEAITAEANGRAQSAKARADQEVKKATAVTLAEQERAVALTQADQAKQVATTKAQQELEVAQLKKQAAEQYKAEQILRGEGDAAYKQKVMEADGALAQKLDTYKATMIGVAEALSKQKLVPDVVLGGATGQNGNQTAVGSFDQYLGVMAAKAAQDLKLNLDVKGNPSVKYPPQRGPEGRKRPSGFLEARRINNEKESHI